MTRSTLFSVAVLASLFVSTGQPLALGGETVIIDVWPHRGPGDVADPSEDTVIPPKPTEQPPTLRLTQVTRPQITVYRPTAETNTGAAVIVLPGGGLNHLAYDKEGTEIAEWLTTIGVTGIVLKYRCPTKDEPERMLKPTQDAVRALRLVRSRAADWGIDESKIGLMGCSAGGGIATQVAACGDRTFYEPIDAVDERDAKPAFVVLLYPAYLLNKTKDALDTDTIHVTSQTPPMFITFAWDDQHPSPAALYLAIALKQANASCELHQYATGGHGYGLRPSDHHAVTWPALCKDWLRSTGQLSNASVDAR